MTKVDTFKLNDGKLCYSVMAHKSQGQTLRKVAICVTEKAFAHGSFYVAVSRVKEFDNILFFGTYFPVEGPSLHSNEFISDLNFKIAHRIERGGPNSKK